LYLNFDEVPLAFDLTPKTTYTQKGEKETVIKATSANKLNATCVLALTSNGSKLPPMIILKNPSAKGYSLENHFPDYLILKQSTSGFINEDILKDYMNSIILNLKLKREEQLHAILDRCKVHLKPSITEMFQQNNVAFSFIPAGTTGFIQPLDFYTNKSFKEYIFDVISANGLGKKHSFFQMLLNLAI